ncbi:MAG: alpha/beta hydrolase, partial [Pseudomonadota bacterium]
MAQLESNGAKIRYDVKGEGEDAIVFVHGHPFDRSMWVQQAEVFAKMGWRCVLFDLRGYGESGESEYGAFAFGQFSK